MVISEWAVCDFSGFQESKIVGEERQSCAPHALSSKAAPQMPRPARAFAFSRGDAPSFSRENSASNAACARMCLLRQCMSILVLGWCTISRLLIGWCLCPDFEHSCSSVSVVQALVRSLPRSPLHLGEHTLSPILFYFSLSLGDAQPLRLQLSFFLLLC